MNAIVKEKRSKELINNQQNWLARLELAYKKTANKTILSHRLHKGPLVIQKPFYPEADVCHSYLIHPPGGIVGGDILELDVELHPGSHALLTTPAASKFYRSSQQQARLSQIFKVRKNAILEWLPQETIFYNDCNASTHTEFDLEDGAHLSYWEMSCFGRPAGKEFFRQGLVKQKITVKRNGIPLYIDRNVIDTQSGILSAIWGLNKFPLMATMLVTLNAKTIDIEAIKELQQHSAEKIVSFTVHHDVLLIRYFGHHAREALALFTQCWSITRPQLIQKTACPPRIWAT